MDQYFWEISNRIQYVEGFPVLLESKSAHPNLSESKFDFARASSYKTTVENWRSLRFTPIYPTIACQVILPDGTALGEGQPIGIARQAYRGSRIYNEGREVGFKFSGASELAILEVKRLFASIGYQTTFSPCHLLWWKSWELKGAIRSIFLWPKDVSKLEQKLHDIAKQFRVELQIQRWVASGDGSILCLPGLEYFGEKQLTQFLELKC